MPNRVVKVIPIHSFDFVNVSSAETVTVTLTKGIDVSQFKEGDLVARLHTRSFDSGCTVAVSAVQDGNTPDDPSTEFLGATVGTLSFSSSDSDGTVKLDKLDQAALGYALAVQLTATQAEESQGNFSCEISIDLVLRD